MSAANNPLFGRRWHLTVTDTDGKTIIDTGFQSFDDPEGLRVRFDVNKVYYSAWWYADIEIYNLTGPVEQQVISQGMMVTLEAGYMHGAYGVLFKGPVFQPKWERIGVTDYVVTLHCLLPLFTGKDNWINLSTAAKLTQRDLVLAMAAGAHVPIPTDSVSKNLSDKTSPLPSQLYGSISDGFDWLAEDNNMQWCIGDGGLILGSLNDASEPVELIFSPAGVGVGAPPAGATASIIGTPQQTQFGVNFRVLCDPRVKITNPAQVLQIANSQIRQMTKQVGQYIGILDNDGIYKVFGIRHHGDTRETDFYTDIVGVTSVGGKLAMGAVESLSGGAGP